MRVSDAQLAEVFDRGWTVVEGFLSADMLAAAREALWEIYPRPEDYFAAPEKHPNFGKSQFSGIRLFPYEQWALNAITVDPDLVDAAERFHRSKDIEIYKVELWGKYAGAIDYDQPHHRDYGNHSIVAPREDDLYAQMTTFILLSDVTEHDGPTKLVPLKDTLDTPLIPKILPMGELFDKEVAATAPAGSLLIYKTNVMHRGSNFTAPGRSRFIMLVDFQRRGLPWNGKMSWPDRANMPAMERAFERMTPRQRDLYGWPPPGSDYWNAQTLRDTQARYPGMDMTPYALPATAERTS